jgi:hypothetical protein
MVETTDSDVVLARYQDKQLHVAAIALDHGDDLKLIQPIVKEWIQRGGIQITDILDMTIFLNPQDIDAPLHIAAERKMNSYRQQYADNQNISFHHAIATNCQHLHPHSRRIFASSFSTGPPGDRGALHCHWHAVATQPIGLVPEQTRGISFKVGLTAAKAAALRINLSIQGCANARSLSRSPSYPPPSFTQSPFSPRSLVRDGQTSPHRPRLVVSRSTCPPLSPSPHANNIVIGTAVINTHRDGGAAQVEAMSVKEMKEELATLGASAEGCCERSEIAEKLRQVRKAKGGHGFSAAGQDRGDKQMEAHLKDKMERENPRYKGCAPGCLLS